MRLLTTIIVTFALVLAAAPVLSAPCESDGCSEQCPLDASDVPCPPICDCCLCCVSISPFVGPVVGALLGIEIRQSPLFDSTNRIEFPYPIEISHVPKFLLA